MNDLTNSTLKEIISVIISKDSAFYISSTMLLGYILVTVQKIARYVYYRVELVYLLDITSNDIFLSSLYALIIIILSFTMNTLLNSYIHTNAESFLSSLKSFLSSLKFFLSSLKFFLSSLKSFYIELFLLLLCFITIFYALALKMSINILIMGFAILVVPSIIIYRIKCCINRDNNNIQQLIARIILICVVFTFSVQYLADFINTRFTYITITNPNEEQSRFDSEYYIVISTFKDCFILKEACMDMKDNSIIIKTNTTRLYPISDCVIYEHYFSNVKTILE